MAGDEPTPKKRRFVFTPIQKPERQAKVPRFDELVFDTPSASPAPEKVVKALGTQDLFIGIDVETHQLAPRAHSRGVEGKFGHWGADLGDACSKLRVVQIGWSFGLICADHPTTKQRLVKPEGFSIDAEATAKHGIANERALSEGHRLADALTECLGDASAVVETGGRLVAHNLTFDGDVLLSELARSGHADKCGFWEEAVKAGVCTMSPAITHWVREMVGDVGVPYYVRMGLKEMVQLLLPSRKDMLRQHHDAGNDAELHWLVCKELCQQARVVKATPPRAG